MTDVPQPERPERLSVGAIEAARILGIGARLLWSMTNRGEVPHVRIGRRVLYPVDSLKRWLVEREEGGGQDD